MDPMAALFRVEARSEGSGRRLQIEGPRAGSGATLRRDYVLEATGQQDYLDLFEVVAGDFGTRLPRNRRPQDRRPDAVGWTPLLTRPLSPGIVYGYGDPAVLRVEEQAGAAYYAFVTSNDAPDAFPILRSTDLGRWQTRGFVFPAGQHPAWAASGPGTSDYWAPELHRIGDRYLLAFTARDRSGSLAIGIARSSSPEGPFAASEQPLLTGGVIDAHIFADHDGTAILLWKEDGNGRWPGLLAQALHRQPALTSALFPDAPDRRTAELTAALWPTMQALAPMERFFLLQPLIEAAVDRYSRLREALTAVGEDWARDILDAMRTPIFAARLADDGASLIGDPRIILVNDLGWEGHLIEGPWLTRRDGRYFLFYAGNDFCTSEYGIGVAVADGVFGPYRKQPDPLLRSSSEWTGPGHPSVADGPDGTPRLFFHAYPPGQTGYKAFRAMLCASLRFDRAGVAVVE
ncbi:MAG TPA: glycoside hydrolase family 43 protein [Allosphingosinicella sp.]|nr:glycoside hydrolase family 43 protein [Allosphingosinicella sp.]